MGGSLSVEEKIFKCAKNGEVAEISSILSQIRRQGQDVQKFLEFQDPAGQTPLIVASYRGYYAVVDLLLQNKANVSHVTRAPDCNTALHEAVQRGHVQIAELLMRCGGNPFLENGRGLTSVDAAINRQHTQMLRSLELRSDFTATLQLKVPRFMGLGAEWKERWCVVMPRYQLTTGRGTVARSLLVCYKDAESCVPSSKVWLDGAIARQVVGSQGDKVLQCALALHKNHAMAANVYMTGDQTLGYTMHFRPKAGAAQAVQALQKFMDLVNGSRHNAAQGRAGGSQPQTPVQPQVASPLAPHTPPAVQPGPSSQQPASSDAEYARMLQDHYNKEWDDHKSQAPVHIADRVSQPYGAAAQPALQSGYPDINANGHQAHHHHQNSAASSSSFHTTPSAPLYPEINLSSGPTTPSIPLDPQATASQGFGASLDWYRNNAHQATAPPASAAQAPADAAAPSKSASPMEDDDAGQCVICMAAPATAGFLHGESVHRCCCMECAKQFKSLPNPTCPMCRQPIQHVILNFY